MRREERGAYRTYGNGCVHMSAIRDGCAKEGMEKLMKLDNKAFMRRRRSETLNMRLFLESLNYSYSQ